MQSILIRRYPLPNLPPGGKELKAKLPALRDGKGGNLN